MRCQRVTRLSLPGMLLASSATLAAPAIPDKAGWSGHFNIGVGIGSSESNMVASIFSQDLGSETVSSLDASPDDEDVALPNLAFEVAYTLADMHTQLYLGNKAEDHLTFDVDTTLETHFGVRQGIPGVGVFDFSYAASASPTDVWKDPYIVDAPRGDTERTSKGIHIEWDGIFDTGLQFMWSNREVEIDDERSGEDGTLGLTQREQRSLHRTGSIHRVEFHYSWAINENHRLVPGIGYLDHDLDGEAMADDGPFAQVQYIYTRNRWEVVSKLFYHDLESGATNPIYGEQRDEETLGGSATVFYAEPFGLQRWTANAGVSFYEGDSNIDFYDSSFVMATVGMLYRFD